MDPSLVTQKEVSDDCEVDAASIEECVSFLSVTGEVHQHRQFDFCQHTDRSFIYLSPTISETFFGFWFSKIRPALHYILFPWENI